MDCNRAQELFSDHLEGTLDLMLRSDLEAHLTACADCRALRETLAQVVGALRSTTPDIEPPAGLAQRVALAALAAPPPLPLSPFAGVPVRVWLAAAALATALGAGVLYGERAGFHPVHGARRLVERSANVAAYLLERKDRLVEDVRLLRVVIGTAFEGRVERVNDRVDDYKKLLEKRREAERHQQDRKGGAAAVESPIRAACIFHGTSYLRTPPSPFS